MSNTGSPSAKLDQMFLRWQQAVQELERQELAVQALRREVLEQEARFKGAIEALGGSQWRWDGEHIFIEDLSKSGARRTTTTSRQINSGQVQENSGQPAKKS